MPSDPSFVLANHRPPAKTLMLKEASKLHNHANVGPTPS
jgi:hypothetical protein